MSKKKMRKTLDLSFPPITPYNQVDNFLNSKNVVTNVLLPSLHWDELCNDPQLKYPAVKRVYKKTLGALENRRNFYKKQRVILVEQWDELEKLEKTLRESFVNLSSFIKSNKDKRERAFARKEEDEKLIAERDTEIKSLIKKIQHLQETKDVFDKQILDHNIYTKYLDSVVEESDEFKNSIGIIDRYESLVQTKKELGERQTKSFCQLESMKNRIEKLAEENAFRLLGMNTAVACMNSRYKSAVTKAMHWEKIVFNIKKNALTRFREINEVKQACRNMYVIMCRRKGETPKIPDNDCLKQLSYIKNTLREMANVRSEAEAITKKTFSSIKAETSKTS